jgi:OmpA-OmpF porin, OOP family
MKCNPLRWLWGLLPILVFTWLAAQHRHLQIERDLTQRTSEALTGAGLTWAKVKFDGRDGVLTGLATEEAEPAKALAIARDISGVRIIDGQAELLKKVDAYVWSATQKDNKVSLAGYVPTEAARASILSSVKSNFPKATVEDKLELARGNPPVGDWLSGITFGLKQLAALKSGHADLNGLTLSVAGEAPTAAAYKDVRSSLATNLPKAVKLGSEKIVPPAVSPFVTKLDVNGSAVDVTGYVPSDAARASIMTALKTKFPGKSLNDKMQVASGQPDGWEACILAGAGGLAKLGNGRAALSGNQLELSGKTDDEALAKALPDDVNGAAKPACIATSKIVYDDTKKREAAAREAAAKEAAAKDAAAREKEAAAREAAAKAAPAPVVAAPVQPDPEAAALAKRQADATAAADAETRAKKEAEAAATAAAQARAEATRLAELAAAEKAKKAASAAACQSELRTAAKAGIVRFERASAALDKQSFATLDQLAGIANKCPGMKIEVEGHTDSEGTPERNKGLSERRAQSVVDHLVGAGVIAERIKGVGYGETKPVATNDTAEGRAQNRRIEFSVTDN